MTRAFRLLCPTALAWSAVLAGCGYIYNWPSMFYGSLLAVAALGLLCAQRGSAAVQFTARTSALLIVLLVGAEVALLVKTKTKPASAISRAAFPTLSYRDARLDPELLLAFWKLNVEEFHREGGVKKTTEMPDPQGTLPFVPVPNSQATYFTEVVRYNSFGFRGDDFAREKGDQFRIFLLGDSPVWGITVLPGDRTIAQLLQGLVDRNFVCTRPVQVINAGIENYNLKDSLEFTRRYILPLKPDVILYYNSILNSLPLMSEGQPVFNPPPARAARASMLIGGIEYRFQQWRYLRRQCQMAAAMADANNFGKTRYMALIREMVAMGKAQGFSVVLATTSLAVDRATPQSVIGFFAHLFTDVQYAIDAVEVQNNAFRAMANAGVPVIETTAELHGRWDADLFMDLVHFARRGSDLMAARLLGGLSPLLSAGAGCEERLPRQPATPR